MIQIGVILVAIAIGTYLSGAVAIALFCLSAGLYFMSTRKVDLGMKVTLKSLVTPVDDSEDSGTFEIVTRIAAYAAFAGGVTVFLSNRLGWF
jgi:hypothetical protein